jgi:hypothetical protein
MPSLIHEMRERRDWQEKRSSGLLPLVAGVLVAFGLGCGGVFAWTKFSGSSGDPEAAPAATVAVLEHKLASFGGFRVGRAETAPLLRGCVPYEQFGAMNTPQMEPGDLYRLLQTGGKLARVAAVAGIQQDAVDPLDFALMWGEVADCVYRQNGPALCDPDNRALAVESITTLVRQVNMAAAQKPVAATDKPKTFREVRATLEGKSRNRTYDLQRARSIKDRVLATLRSRVSEGRLIASDFGFFTPDEVKQALRDTKTLTNSCSQ